METQTKNLFIVALAMLLLLMAATIAMRQDMRQGDRGIILGVHSEVASGKFKSRLGLPYGQEVGGHYAVVDIEDGAYGDASFALVYVPPRFTVHDNDIVELNASGISVLARPGSASVKNVVR